MMRFLVVASILIMGSSALGVVDTGSDCIGLYFDQTADTTQIHGVEFPDQVVIYLVLVNPTFELLHGYEIGGWYEGQMLLLSEIFANPQALDVGDMELHDIVGFGTPTVCQQATLLKTITYLYWDENGGPVTFNLSGSEPSSNNLGLPSLFVDGEILTAGFSTADGTHCATINSDTSVVATEPRSMDSVKSLYR